MVLLLAAALGFAASDSENIAAVKKAEAAMREALVHSDTKAMARLLTDDFVRTPPTTPATTKTEWIGQIESGRLRYVSFEVQDAKYRGYGDTVLVNSVAKIRARTSTGEADLMLRLLAVWVKQNGEWREAAVQGNPMPGN
jgi:ketosteroid isomerase-like protein